MMRRSAGFDAEEARRQPLKEWQNVPALELTANDYITRRVNSVDLKNRLGDIETDCRDRLHVWLLRIVGALTAPTSMALPCRWRSRPQHQKPTLTSALLSPSLLRGTRRRNVRLAEIGKIRAHQPHIGRHPIAEGRVRGQRENHVHRVVAEAAAVEGGKAE